MYILEYVEDYSGRNILTEVFYNTESIIYKVAERSNNDGNFKVVRINKYEEGTLVPQEIVYNGRIEVKEIKGDK